MAGPRPALHVVGAALVEGGRCLATRRGPGMALAGRWEFPGGKVEPGERPTAALAREVEEELDVAIEAGPWLGRGESRTGGRPVVLDVYAARRRERSPPLALREHDRAAWCRAEELDALDWAEADVPVLPAVEGWLRGAEAQRLPGPAVVLSADWSGDARRRAVYAAQPGGCGGRGWRVARCAPPAQGWSLTALAARARTLRRGTGLPVLVGVDAVLGLPRALARRAGFAGFREALETWTRAGALAREAGCPAAWSPETPFFRVPPGRGGLGRFADAAGGRSGLLRQVERRAGAKPAFVLSGVPGSVGSGTRALWRELAEPAGTARGLALWPFDGSLVELTRRRAPVLAEVYPRASYAFATAETLPTPPRALAKTKPAVRARALRALADAAWVRRHRVALADLDAAAASEDDFDALMTAAALVRLLAEGRPLADTLVDPAHEGGILGTGGIAWPPPRRPRGR